ncbi:hypothetical protein UlMin_036475, partial [Ulmus minor]
MGLVRIRSWRISLTNIKFGGQIVHFSNRGTNCKNAHSSGGYPVKKNNNTYVMNIKQGESRFRYNPEGCATVDVDGNVLTAEIFFSESFSDPPSPSKYKPSADCPDIEEELLLESDSDVDEEIHDIGEEIHPLDEESKDYDSGVPDSTDLAKPGILVKEELERQTSSSKRLDRLNCLRTEGSSLNVQVSGAQNVVKLTKMLSGSERIGLSWPEPPLNWLSEQVLERPHSFKAIKSFKASKSFRTYSSFKSTANFAPPDIALLAEIDLESLMKRKRRSSYVRIASKQMVGIFLTVWVRRSLRRHIQNVKVSTVGVGVMGYIGNKGSVSVSMSIYQTLFCFICTHLTLGEKEVDRLKRNAD